MPNFHGDRPPAISKRTSFVRPCPHLALPAPFPAQWVEPRKDHVWLRHAGLLQFAEVESGDRLGEG